MTVLFVNIDIGHFSPLLANGGFVNMVTDCVVPTCLRRIRDAIKL